MVIIAPFHFEVYPNWFWYFLCRSESHSVPPKLPLCLRRFSPPPISASSVSFCLLHLRVVIRLRQVSPKFAFLCFVLRKNKVKREVVGWGVMILVNKVIFCVNNTLNPCRNAQNMHTSNECSICRIKYHYDFEFLVSLWLVFLENFPCCIWSLLSISILIHLSLKDLFLCFHSIFFVCFYLLLIVI